MSALSDYLEASRASVVKALGKRYMAGTLGEDQTPEGVLASVGLNDPTDTAYQIAAWDFLKESGAEPPEEAKPARDAPDQQPATDKQLAFIAKLADGKGVVGPELPLSKERASECIEQLQNGSYDPDKWNPPF